MSALNKKTVWSGKYKEISFECVNWTMGGSTIDEKDCWNYYISLPIAQIPDNFLDSFILKSKKTEFYPDGIVDYCSVPIISDLDWHGGITFYEKIYDEEGKLFSIKMGCDYLHFFDENKHYNIDIVSQDAMYSISVLLRHIPNMKIRCGWDGTYHNQNEMIKQGDNWYFKDNIKKMEESNIRLTEISSDLEKAIKKLEK